MPKKEIPDYRRIDIFLPISPARIKYIDVIDLREFYDSLHEWLMENDWKDEGEDSDKYETYYGERIDRNGGREIHINWRMYKKPPNTDAFVYYMDVYYHCIAIRPTEIVKEGKKLKVNKGIVEMKIAGYIDEVYKEKFMKSKILKPLLTLFSKRIYHDATNLRKKELYQEIYSLQNWMKQYMKLKRYLPYDEVKSFYPGYAWPSHIQEKE